MCMGGHHQEADETAEFRRQVREHRGEVNRLKAARWARSSTPPFPWLRVIAAGALGAVAVGVMAGVALGTT
jgi:hypothetical protein